MAQRKPTTKAIGVVGRLVKIEVTPLPGQRVEDAVMHAHSIVGEVHLAVASWLLWGASVRQTATGATVELQFAPEFGDADLADLAEGLWEAA